MKEPSSFDLRWKHATLYRLAHAAPILLLLGCSSGSSLPGPAGAASGNPPGTIDAGFIDSAASDRDGAIPSNDAASSQDGGTGPDAGSTLDAGPIVTHYVAGVTVSTLAGSSAPGVQDGTGVAAQFDNPTGLALIPDGSLLVTDYDGARVRHVTSAGVVTTLAAATGFVDPFAAVVASDGAVYVETDANSAGMKSAMSGTIWRVTSLGDGGVATPTVVAQGFGRPRGLAPVAGGNLFVMDRTQGVAELLDVASGALTFLAGSATIGFADGSGAQAKFDSPVGAAAMPDGSFIVTDAGNNRLRRITAGGVVTTYAGDGVAWLVDGSCASARFNAPRGVAADAAGNLYVSDIGNHVIRRIATDCTVETLAGDGSAGFNDGTGSAAELYGQEGIAVTPDGKTVYVADGNGGDGSGYHRVRKIAIP
jgi:glucose/arabinose dehydrogenase